ncbi:unnamed protein product [Phytomonas sp. EM1]|nr:unnamed protein product [Phytomonas sp. EM1]|eukprot:CCW62627.1 unnamed protein product [Phytomonas sp. isolate EM1]
MSIAFRSSVDCTNADYSFESDGSHPSYLPTSSPFQAEYNQSTKSSLCSNEPDTTKDLLKGHSAEGNAEMLAHLQHSVDEVCGRNNSFNQKLSHHCKRSDDNTRREESFVASERASALQATTLDAAGAWARVTQLGDMTNLLPYSRGIVELEAFAALTPATITAGKGSSMPLITANDYSDRQRLLYHITYLHTQLQRAFLQIQEQQRIITILQASANVEVDKSNRSTADASTKSVGHSSTIEDQKKEVSDDVVILRIAASCTAAAVAASRTEEALHAALHESLALFDPVIAQSQIKRLDDALAHLSLLREAELQQLQRGEEELKELRKSRNDLVKQTDALQSSCEELTAKNEELRASSTSASLEVERLRQEELRLSRRIVAMEGLLRTGNLYDGLQVVGVDGGHQQVSQPRGGVNGNSGLGSESAANGYNLGVDIEKLNALSEEETTARQALLQDLFWEPMLIAFDAGLTWTEEFLALAEEGNASALGKGLPHDPGDNFPIEVVVSTQTAGSNTLNELTEAMRAPATDADLLLLRSQQDEIQQLQRQMGVLKERQRMADLEIERLGGLYANEQRRSENLARDHSEQLQRAYQELVKDRHIIAQQLREEVEKQVRMAFRDGRQYERQRQGAAPVAETVVPDSLRDAEKTQETRHLNTKPPLMRSKIIS